MVGSRTGVGASIRPWTTFSFRTARDHSLSRGPARLTRASATLPAISEGPVLPQLEREYVAGQDHPDPRAAPDRFPGGGIQYFQPGAVWYRCNSVTGPELWPPDEQRRYPEYSEAVATRAETIFLTWSDLSTAECAGSGRSRRGA